jgi:hypothetical protein
VDEVRISPAGDPFYAASKRTETELIEAIAEDEAVQGRPHAPREREAFARGFFGEAYRCEIRRLAALGIEPPEED